MAPATSFMPTLLALAATVAFAQQVTIQRCLPASLMPAEQWTLTPVGSAVSVSQPGGCIASNNGFLSLTACAPSSPSQQWIFHDSDGTVESVASAGQCWNVWQGSVAPGTPIGLYTCGSLPAIAANDVFSYNVNAGTLLANESGLCLSTSAPPPGVCASDLDCNLNGVCDTSHGVCVCDAPWTGPACGSMALLPVSPLQGYGMAPNLTSWGGNMIQYGGLYHLYVAEMVLHCPLSDWGRNSQVSHAVASAPTGPFVYSDTALPVWAHNPQVVPFKNGSSDAFALFHIGGANGGNPVNCSAGEVGASALHAPPASALHVASSPYGPWVPVLPGPQGCNNPSPYLHANGTWYLLCDSSTLQSAPGLDGPWTNIGTVTSGGVPGSYEDAFLYMDARGRWHVIFHVYNATTPCGECDGSLVSGHSYSLDGLRWYGSDVSPFGNVVQLKTGGNWTLATRERPKLFFNSAGQPTHLLNGVCGGTSTCPPTPGVNCKYDYWDFTLVQPLDLGAQ